MEHLDRLGLRGPYQVHVAPVTLVPDERAHQVFLGFGEAFGETARRLTERYGGHAHVVALRGRARLILTLDEAAAAEWQDGDAFVIAAQRTDQPGGLYGLVWIVDRLLGPGGCPWDQAQTHASLKRHLVEECYELIESIDATDDGKMCEELGDVLLQPLMHSQMEQLAGNWGIESVSKGIADKLVRRHPHVFGDVDVADADEVLRNWDAIKRTEGKEEAPKSILDGVPKSLPALLRAYEVSKRAARNGFEWPDLDGVWDKLREEEAELRHAVEAGEGVADELGDMLFTIVNIARWLEVEPEDALRQMVDRFTQRFQAMERMSEKPLRELDPAEWDALWNSAKSALA